MRVPDHATAFAPASVGNVAVGFDILGHALDAVGDTVTVHRRDEPIVRILRIDGADRALPTLPEQNTAGRALIEMRRGLGLRHGFDIEITKGIPFGSGLGGSAASATAAVVAANALLEEPLARAALYPYALAGESVASGSAHGDNVAPQLLGGLVLVAPGDPARLVSLPVPEGLHCAVVKPGYAVETRAARAALSAPYPLAQFVGQSACLAAFVAACYRNEAALLRGALRDLLVEPRRAALVPGFPAVQHAALAADALGCSISGAGPSVFAWFLDAESARAGASAMQAAFAQAGHRSDAWVSPVDAPGARLVGSRP